MKKSIRLVVTLAIFALLIGLGKWGWDTIYGDQREIEFHTDSITRNDVMTSISASGTVEPEELVNVGAQVNGKIMSFGTDVDGKTIDYGSRVTAGMVLANIDKVLYVAALGEAKGEKLKAQVGMLSAQANLNQAQAKFALADHNWTRARELHPKGSLSKSGYDSAEAEYLTCKANIEVAEASVAQARAQMEIAEAALVKAERNLSYCVIVSPVDGVIIDRRVSVGQTLVSNMSASSVFLIATDLKKMQVWASVNEADIGGIYVGMPVIFQVDAFPGEKFFGTVHKVRLNATMSQNVVTYVVEISTDNTSGRLLPYLTANVKFVRQQSKDALNVPNSALRYAPPVEFVDANYRDKIPDGKKVWVIGESGMLRPIAVETGISSGMRVEIKGEGIAEGMEVVTGHTEKVVDKSAEKEAQKSPFTPDVPKRVRNSAKDR